MNEFEFDDILYTILKGIISGFLIAYLIILGLRPSAEYPDNIIELMYPNNNFGYILNVIVERIDYLKSNNENNINEEIKILKQLIKQYNENYDNASPELGYMYLLQDVDEHTQNEILEQIAEIETQAYFDELDLN